jgi:hypothetical protein
MNPGYFQANYFPDDYWQEDYWPDFGGLLTAAVHIFSSTNIAPNHISDSGNNVLTAGQTEAQGGGFFGGATNYTQMTDEGVVSQESSTGSRPLLRYSLMGV